MPVALLIGLEYSFNPLAGAIVDLYHAHRWCQTFVDQVYVLTDITAINNPDTLKEAINQKVAAPDLLTFYETCTPKIIIRDKDTLLSAISGILKKGVPDGKLVIYYSGHGVKESMVMPDKTFLPFRIFREAVLSTLEPYVEIFMILDCCNPDGLYLPYKLQRNRFRLSPAKIECVTQPILLITSAEANEKSISTNYGSVFSRYLFRGLRQLEDPGEVGERVPLHKNRNLRRLIGNLASAIRRDYVGYVQTVSIYSSYIVDPVLWMWIGSARDYDIVMDLTASFFVIRHKEIQPPTPPELPPAPEPENLTKTSPYLRLYGLNW